VAGAISQAGGRALIARSQAGFAWSGRAIYVSKRSKSIIERNFYTKMSVQTGGDDIVEGLIFDTGLWLYLCACATTAKPPRGRGCWPEGVLAKGWSRVIPVSTSLSRL
jgi:hypothetical protein